MKRIFLLWGGIVCISSIFLSCLMIDDLIGPSTNSEKSTGVHVVTDPMDSASALKKTKYCYEEESKKDFVRYDQLASFYLIMKEESGIPEAKEVLGDLDPDKEFNLLYKKYAVKSNVKDVLAMPFFVPQNWWGSTKKAGLNPKLREDALGNHHVVKDTFAIRGIVFNLNKDKKLKALKIEYTVLNNFGKVLKRGAMQKSFSPAIDHYHAYAMKDWNNKSKYAPTQAFSDYIDVASARSDDQRINSESVGEVKLKVVDVRWE